MTSSIGRITMTLQGKSPKSCFLISVELRHGLIYILLVSPKTKRLTTEQLVIASTQFKLSGLTSMNWSIEKRSCNIKSCREQGYSVTLQVLKQFFNLLQ